MFVMSCFGSWTTYISELNIYFLFGCGASFLNMLFCMISYAIPLSTLTRLSGFIVTRCAYWTSFEILYMLFCMTSFAIPLFTLTRLSGFIVTPFWNPHLNHSHTKFLFKTIDKLYLYIFWKYFGILH